LEEGQHAHCFELTTLTKPSTIALTVAALNDLNIMACDIQNAYLTADCREKCWTAAGPDLRSKAGLAMIIKKALYGLKSSGAAFRAHLAETLDAMGYKPSYADPGVWLRTASSTMSTYYDMLTACCASLLTPRNQ
jgi:hypothetical protein